ncbi:MAG TPA: hypothetical protein VEK57_21925 [Thermoanaerobaculia bacterium]|nr:hypothetical protein [Thermoanaerobaculia bacterium]
MTATTTGELTASALIGLIESGTYPREIVTTIARGFLPLPQEDLIGVLAYLALQSDEELAGFARASLESEVPTRALFEYASNERNAADHLARLLLVTRNNLVLEALIRNKTVSDTAIADLARRADAHVQEVVVINQARILRAPEILEALLENPALSPDVRRRALETKEEFFEKKARLQQIEEEAAAAAAEEPPLTEDEAPLDAIADLLEKAAVFEETAPTVQLAELEKQDDRKAALWARLNFMTVAEKVQLAFRGDKTARMLLVRERNKLICSGVMRNPRISETEVEQIAGMRNVEDEVLRLIGMRRDWMSKYNIMLTLCRNPKVPLGVVLPLINRLTLRDLKGLKDDRGVQNAVREMARKTYLMKTQKN